ncbi:EEF1AKNMT [Symbiodinium sp. CCMP2592]|nr:EEF1AKNMT [Symbiodinium sp. CCMP2592]
MCILKPWLQLLMGAAVVVGRTTDALHRIRTLLADVEANAKELFEAGSLDAAAARGLTDALAGAERKLAKETSSEGQELYFMSRILRGTIYQQAFGFDDQEVETRDAYTLSNARFWEDYYNSTDLAAFDWYGSWNTEAFWLEDWRTERLGAVLQTYLRPSANILVLGCGRSDLSERMYLAGYQNITNIDISISLLKRLEGTLGPSLPGMSWKWMNVSAMSADSSSFDIVVEKGTYDSLQENPGLLQAASAETHRVLRDGGLLISITDTPPDRRLEQLRPQRWQSCVSHSGNIDTTSGQKDLFVHVCRKPTSTGWLNWLWRRLFPSLRAGSREL